MFIKLFGYTLDIIPTVEQWWPLAYPMKNTADQITEEWTRKIERAIETQTPIEPMEVVVTCKGWIEEEYLVGLHYPGRKELCLRP